MKNDAMAKLKTIYRIKTCRLGPVTSVDLSVAM